VGAQPDPTGATGIAGYAITGRAGGHGFLQRLAVHPTWQRRGVGRALVIDGLAWLERRGVERVVVNTQLENRKALALYEGLGFRREPRCLSVLSAGVRP
jgi:ribosomal protein S18 acetylase RimI-like enzyme